MSKFTKILASAIAVATMTVCLGTIGASAETRATATPVTWRSSTSGNTTTYTAEVYTGMVGGFVECNSATYLAADYTHNSNYVWTSEAQYKSGSSTICRNMTVSTQFYDVTNSKWIYSAADSDSAQCYAGTTLMAMSQYSSLPRRYYYYYTSSIFAGSSTYTPVVERIDFYERYVS